MPAIFMVKYFVSILLVGVGVLSQSAAAELGQAVGLAAVKDPAKLGFDAKKLDAVFAALGTWRLRLLPKRCLGGL